MADRRARWRDEGELSGPHGQLLPPLLWHLRRTGSRSIYFTKFGARKLAHYVEREIERTLSSQKVPVALPVPAEPEHRGSKGNRGLVRSMAGPVVPLTGTNVGSERVLLGGPGETTRGLGAGEAVVAPSGRADDFRWPRGVFDVEPAVAEPAAAGTAADAGDKSAESAQSESVMDAYAAQTLREQKRARRRRPH